MAEILKLVVTHSSETVEMMTHHRGFTKFMAMVSGELDELVMATHLIEAITQNCIGTSLLQDMIQIGLAHDHPKEL